MTMPDIRGETKQFLFRAYKARARNSQVGSVGTSKYVSYTVSKLNQPERSRKPLPIDAFVEVLETIDI